MGFVRKLTGVQAQIDATNKNADAQMAATVQASRDQQAALSATAKAAADQQSQIAARSAVEAKASEAASQPLDSADVQLADTPTESVAATRAKRKASYGRNYAGGVSI